MERYNLESGIEDTPQQRFRKEEAYIRARKKLDALKGFYWHLASYIVVNLFLIILIGVNSSNGFFSFGTYATALFWGIGLFFHFLGVFGPDFIFGKKWEERKIKEIMDKENKSWK
ncbi:2TM domain-containing protein [Ichthyenterobacterium magnum]|uniref:2TM domain-containing protein n=1 Tax=Ichthyenterobacterium magnum TaxID=1230530 RepID=A0A420DUV1_9FLAO|nr:2TM domain-containing protein [Ichthyenterobacterium magnum]RKE97940.1 2TM domain-containing protein [Ichthyenterobacterium magnum]